MDGALRKGPGTRLVDPMKGAVDMMNVVRSAVGGALKIEMYAGVAHAEIS